MRAVRAMGYYDDAHPVFRRTQAEAIEALKDVTALQGTVTLGCGGSHIVYGAQTAAIADDVGKALGKCMFNRSLVAIRLPAHTPQDELGRLLALLADAEDRVRAEGGVRRLLAEQDVTALAVIEVDYARLFEGEHADLGAIVGDDPVVERALREVLRFKSVGEGQTLTIKIDDLDSPASLGGFLDELIDKSEAAVVDEGSVGAPGGAKDIPIDSFADLASDAFFTNQHKLHAGGASQADIAKSAQVLGDALVRLSPTARVELLKKLAGANRVQTPVEEAACGALGQALEKNLIVDAIASTLVSQQGDHHAVEAIGNLVRRLRPLEKDRAELLEAIDGAMESRGQKADGLVWQEIQSRALDNEELGYLKMAFDNVREGLAKAADHRRRGQVAIVPGQEILQGASPEVIDRYSADLLSQVLTDSRTVGLTVVNATRDLIEKLERSGEMNTSTGLIASLVRRADIDEPVTRRFSRAPSSMPPGSLPPRRMSMSTRSLTPPPPRTAALSGGGVSTTPPMRGPSTAPPGTVDEDEATARTVLNDLLTGPGGEKRTMRLLQAGSGQGAVMAEILLDGIEQSADPTHQELLLDKLSAIDPRILQKMAMEGHGDTRIRAHHLVRASARRDVRTALKIVRYMLRSPSLEVKEASLKALIGIEDANVLGFLQMASGVKGDEQAKKFLFLEGADADKRLHRVKQTAISALGLTRSPHAVPTLNALVSRAGGGLFSSSKPIDELRGIAAFALATNGTPQARQALEAGAKSKKKPIREACQKALMGFDDAGA